MVGNGRVHYLASACQFCKSNKTDYICLVCRLAFYCSSDHRKQDWYNHSRLCWAINKIYTSEKVKHLLQLFNGNDFTAFRHKIAGKCIELLERGLYSWELEMLYHPRVCNVCREYDWTKLKPCGGCNLIYTCAKEHFPKNHFKWCETLKIYSETVRFEETTKISLAVLESHLKISDCLPENMSELLSKSFDEHTLEHSFSCYSVEKGLISELLTYPLTIFNSLREIGIQESNEITVLFIGAEIQAEVEPIWKWEKYLLHLLPKVHNLKLIFLGPELRENDKNYSSDLCNQCRFENKILESEFIYNKLYHESSIEKHVQIDLICALNSGMYRGHGYANTNSWKETIIKLFSHSKTPVLITEYTRHELEKDLNAVKKLCGKFHFVERVKVNPFSSMKPGLNIISEMEVPVIFKNYFSVILRKK